MEEALPINFCSIMSPNIALFLYVHDVFHKMYWNVIESV